MSDLYVRIVNGTIVATVPFTDMETNFSTGKLGVKITDDVEINTAQSTGFIILYTLQLCVKLGDDLYVWQEWEDLYSENV